MGWKISKFPVKALIFAWLILPSGFVLAKPKASLLPKTPASQRIYIFDDKNPSDKPRIVLGEATVVDVSNAPLLLLKNKASSEQNTKDAPHKSEIEAKEIKIEQDALPENSNQD